MLRESSHIFLLFYIKNYIKINNNCHFFGTCTCLLATTGEDNSHHYFVASQDPELRRELRKLAGVPIFHIIRNTIVLEKPTKASQDQVDKV